MSKLKPLTASQIQGALKSTKYPTKQVSKGLVNSLIKLTSEQIKDGKNANDIANYLAMAVANRLPKGCESIDFAHEVQHRFLKANGSVEV